MSNVSLRLKILMTMIPTVFGILALAVYATKELGNLQETQLSKLSALSNESASNRALLQSLNTLLTLQGSHFLTNSLEQHKAIHTQIELLAKTTQEQVTALAEHAVDSDKESLGIAKKQLTDWLDVGSQIQKLILNKQTDQAKQFFAEKSILLHQGLIKTLNSYQDRGQERLKDESEGAQLLKPIQTKFWAFALLVSLLEALVTVFAVFSLTRMTRSIDHILQSLSGNSNVLGKTSSDLASASQKISEAATQQAASLAETAASVEQISAMVSLNADNAQKSLTVANKGREVANQGNKAVEEMIQAIAEIDNSIQAIMQQTETSNKEISEIVKVIGEIGNRTKVINDIVFQTKLLSFNASVEAARAGEHGKGFAVVAEEVGNLAQMSGKASKEISSMLNEGISKVERIIKETQMGVAQLVSDCKKRVESGAQISRRCGESLKQIVHDVDEINQVISGISKASQEQSTGIQEITMAMGLLDQVTQSNATTAQESAQSTNLLLSQTKLLDQAILDLALITRGSEQSTQTSQKSQKSQKSQTVTGTPTPRSTAKPKRPQSTGVSANVIPLKRPIIEASESQIPSENDARFKDI